MVLIKPFGKREWFPVKVQLSIKGLSRTLVYNEDRTFTQEYARKAGENLFAKAGITGVTKAYFMAHFNFSGRLVIDPKQQVADLGWSLRQAPSVGDRIKSRRKEAGRDKLERG